MDDRPKLIKILIFSWLILGIVFVAGGIWLLSNWLLSSFSANGDFLAGLMMAALIYLILPILLFICAFFSFILAYETLKGKKWVRQNGFVLAIIFFLIFLVPLGSLIWVAIEHPSVYSSDITGILAFVATIVIMLIDIGIIVCLTRPEVKNYFK